ncbi:methionine adenosyltransferase 2 subunit beta-like [Gigantopelta aegis]|uniref:methionine adenosyltransferase 2 subunit beta-like n=1 Tax=Gigantopelta aegis TaxID=1735272 RepID=UPI001B88B93D|nr:methionine adenosyltransferase 2 subunit beta-like [Gigantopelta aegis]
MIMSKRVLITGASGLLGRALFKEFESDASWDVLGLAFSRIKDPLRKVDLRNKDDVEQVIITFKPNVIIHSAAERRPDVVEKQEEATHQLNVAATQFICEAAVKVGAWVLFISTDYVFDGKNPPHAVGDLPNPLNKYGKSKLEGEKVTLSVNPGNALLRVPILYGELEYLEESAVTVLFTKVRATDTPCVMSDYERRYPTSCQDIAIVVRQLTECRLKDSSICGIFHWSGNEEMTKYDMAVDMAEVFGLPTNHIQRDKSASGGAIRPYNAKLDISRLEHMGITQRTPFKTAIKCVLERFMTN